MKLDDLEPDAGDVACAPEEDAAPADEAAGRSTDEPEDDPGDDPEAEDDDDEPSPDDASAFPLSALYFWSHFRLLRS